MRDTLLRAARLPHRVAQQLGSAGRRSGPTLTPRQAHYSSSSSSSAPGVGLSAGQVFLRSDEGLVAKLQKRQLRYRFSVAGSSEADQQEARELAQAEIRWLVEEARLPSISASSSSPSPSASREQRRHLIRMAREMTRLHKPLSYVLGHHPFANLPRELIVRPPSLIPRPEAEEWASQLANTLSDALSQRAAFHPSPSSSDTAPPPFKILDLCTGSGCIAVLLAHTLLRRLDPSGWHVTACDRCDGAVQLARDNAERIGIPRDNLSICRADVFDDAEMRDVLSSCSEAAAQPFDLVVCNPPYIPRSDWETLDRSVKDWEDPLALIGERPAGQQDKAKHRATASYDGLDFYHRLRELVASPAFLAPPVRGRSSRLPRLVAEFGKGQHERVEKIFSSTAASPSSSRTSPLVASSSKVHIPSPRKIVRLRRKLMVAALGNYTHPLTRHSIGQLLLENLPVRFHARTIFQHEKLQREADRLERHRRHLIDSGKVSRDQAGMYTDEEFERLGNEIRGPLLQLANAGGETAAADAQRLPPPPDSPEELTTHRDTRGWSCTVPLLLDPNPIKGQQHQRSPSAAPLPYVQLDLILYKPRYFMNESGKGVSKALQFHGILRNGTASSERYADLLVVHDELSRDFGKVSRKNRGSAAGHNGVRSCFSSLKVRDVERETMSRLRIGIGRAEDAKRGGGGGGGWLKDIGRTLDTATWVLGKMDDEQIRSCRYTELGGQGEEWRVDETRPLPKSLEISAEGTVLELTTREVVKWAKERVAAALKDEGWKVGRVEAEPIRPKPKQQMAGDSVSHDKESELEIRKDLFGVERTVWMY